MKFTLTIELGNDAMQTNQDIRDALKNVICQVGSVQYGNAEPTDGDGAKIRDINGNTVGHWRIDE